MRAKSSRRFGEGGRNAEEKRRARITRAAHERAPMHMLDIPMDLPPYGGRGQRRSGRLPTPASSFHPSRRRPSSFLQHSGSPSKHHKDSPPPILPRANHERGVCIGTHMSRIPTVFPLVRKKKREREAHIAVTLWERSRERTKEMLAFLSLRSVHTHTYARVRRIGNDRRHVHSRARPFAALSRSPPFKTARAMDRRIGALFLFATHA